MKLTRARLLFAMMAASMVVAWLPVAVMAAKGMAIAGREGRALVVFQAFAPLIGALVGQSLLPRGPIARPLGLTLDMNRFWTVAWAAPLFVAVVGIGTSYFFGAEPVLTLADLVRAKRALVPVGERAAWEAALREHPMQPPYVLLTMALLAGLSINIFPAMAEEIGLRGFLFREMPGGFFARSLRIGLFEGVLALPVVLLGWGFPDHPIAGAAITLLRALLFAMAALYLRARCESVLPVAVFHGTFVALLHPAIDLTPGASDIVRPMLGLSGCIGLAALVGAFAVHDRYFARAKLMFPPKPGPM